MSYAEVTICQRCAKEFRDGVMSETQAHGCACNVFNGFIYSHYGSKHDTRLLRSGDVLANMDPICDECIDLLIREGLVTDEREYLDFNETEGGPN